MFDTATPISQMKLLFINSFFAPNVRGGAEGSVAKIAQGLQNRGHQVRVMATVDGSSQRGITTAEGVEVSQIPIRNLFWPSSVKPQPAWKRFLWHLIDVYNPAMGHEVGRVLDEYRPEVVFCHNLSGFSIATWRALSRRGIPFLQVLHDYYHLCPKTTLYHDGKNCREMCSSCRLLRLPHRYLSSSASAAVGVSSAVLQRHLDEGYFSGVRVRSAVYNARTVEETIRKPYNESSVFSIGFIGKVSREKGIEVLIRGFVELKKRVSREISLVVAGRGNPDFVEELRSSYPDEKISFIGQQNSREFYKSVDIVVVPSLWSEPLGNVVYESLAMGVPVVAAASGGIPEMIKPMENGLLYSPNHPEDLATCLARLIDDRDLYETISRNARKSVARFIDPERMVDEYERILSALRGDQTTAFDA